MKVVVISSSIRPGRTSHRVALHLANRLNAVEGVEAEVLDLAAHNLPLLEETFVRHTNKPAAADELGNILNQADAMLFVSPEYNGTYTAALKNITDYYNKAEFQRKVIGTVTVSTGMMGGIRAALQMQQLIMALFAYTSPHMLPVGMVLDKFEEDGTLKQPEYEKNLAHFTREFLWLATAVKAKKDAEVALAA